MESKLEGNDSVRKGTPQGAGKNQRDCSHDSERLGEIEGESRALGNDPRETLDSDSQSGTNRSFQSDRKATPGGILRQLKSLREAHLAYAIAHGQRLEARLAENKAYIQQINEELDALEQQISSLLNVEDIEESDDDAVNDRSDEEE